VAAEYLSFFRYLFQPPIPHPIGNLGVKAPRFPGCSHEVTQIVHVLDVLVRVFFHTGKAAFLEQRFLNTKMVFGVAGNFIKQGMESARVSICVVGQNIQAITQLQQMLVVKIQDRMTSGQSVGPDYRRNISHKFPISDIFDKCIS
jgi:hypothetical protein